jgi:MscS family membrane protein
MNYSNITNDILSYLSKYFDQKSFFQLSLEVSLILFIAFIINVISHKILFHYHVKAERDNKHLKLAVLSSINAPLKTLVYFIGLILIAELIDKSYKLNFYSVIQAIKNIGIILCAFWFVNNLIKMQEKYWHSTRYQKQNKLDPTTADAVVTLLRVVAIIIVALMILQVIGFSISGIIAFGGIGGVAVGFASKDLLANFFGAVMIFLDRPFQVGDWIRSPDKQIEGYVEKITLRVTVIRTFEKCPLYVPNSVFSTISLENPSRMSHRRIKEVFNLRPQDIENFEKIIKQVDTMLRKHKEIDQNQPIVVGVNSTETSALPMLVQFYTKKTELTEFNSVKRDIFIKIMKIIDANNAQVAQIKCL